MPEGPGVVLAAEGRGVRNQDATDGELGPYDEASVRESEPETQRTDEERGGRPDGASRRKEKRVAEPTSGRVRSVPFRVIRRGRDPATYGDLP